MKREKERTVSFSRSGFPEQVIWKEVEVSGNFRELIGYDEVDELQRVAALQFDQAMVADPEFGDND